MGIIKRFCKIDQEMSLSLGKLRMGGLAVAFILILGFGVKFIPRWLDLSQETTAMANKVIEFVIAVVFVSIVVFRLARLSARNRWAMVCIFGCGALIGLILAVLFHLGEEKTGLSEYFPYDVIIYAITAVGGYIAWRVQTARLRRIKLEREARIKRHRSNNL